MKKVRLQTVIMVVGLLSLLVVSATAGQGQTPKTLKIGELACLTGFLSGVDTIMYEAMKMEANIINKQGGVTVKGQHYNIEVVTEDGKSSLDGITAAATKLIIDDGVKFIVGPSAFFSSAAAPPAEANKVLHVSVMNVGTPGEMNKDMPYAFLGSNGSAAMNLCMIQALKKAYPNVKKVGFIMPDDGSVPYLVPLVEKAMADAGLQHTGKTVTYANETQDFSSIAIRLNGISDADAYVFVNGIPPHIAGVLKQLRQAGNYKPIVCDMGSSDILPMVNSDALATELITKDISIDQPGNPPLIDNLLNTLTTKFGHEKQISYPDHASCLYTLVYVIGQAQSLDPTVVKNKWETLATVPTLFGKGTLGGEKTYGLKNHAVTTPLPFAVTKNGKATPLGWVTPAALP